MNKKQEPSQMNNATQARVFSIQELPGRFGKYIEVGNQEQGIIIHPNGEAQVLQPGRHKVLSTWDRLRGKGIGLITGVYPAGNFYSYLRAPNLLSGDETLLDVGLLLCLRVSQEEASRFFLQAVLPEGDLNLVSMPLTDAAVLEALNALVRQYAADDLISAYPLPNLQTEISQSLNELFRSQGLALITISLINFRRAADRALIAEKAQRLEERLADVEIQKKMAEIENQAQLDEFMQQFDGDLAEKSAIRISDTPASSQIGGSEIAVDGMLKIWADAESQEKDRGLAWRLRSSLRRQPKDEKIDPKLKEVPTKRQLRIWLLRRLLGIFISLAFGGLVSYAVVLVAEAASWDLKWEFLLIIWGPIAGYLVHSIMDYIKKGEQLEEARWGAEGKIYLDDLTGNDRQKVDALVREQCRSDLTHSSEILNELRSRVYRDGEEDLALKLRQLEKKIQLTAQKIQQGDFGKPAYLEDLKIKPFLWEKLLNYDEMILVNAALFSEKTYAIQRQYAQGDLDDFALSKLEQRLDHLSHRFENRSRVLKLSAEKLQAGQI
jgi:hypothetical protein